MGLLLIIFIALLGLLILILLIRKKLLRSHRSLQRWVDENDYTLVSKKHSVTYFFKKGPYRWASRDQAVFRVVVIDEQKMERSGWVRCGSYFKGAAFSDDVVGVLDPEP